MGAKTKNKEINVGAIALLKLIKGLFAALIITFAGVIIFAFTIKWASLDDSIIPSVNLGIKAISILLGVLIINKNANKKLINGVIFSILYTLISFIIFSLLAGNFVLGFGLIADFGFNIMVGAVASLLSAIKNK